MKYYTNYHMKKNFDLVHVYARLKRGVTRLFTSRENIYWIYFPFEDIDPT
jgi:hypothetical protein